MSAGAAALELPFAIGTPTRSLGDYLASGQTLSEETFLGVAGAQILLANYDLLRADFPQAWFGSQRQEDIQSWLLDTAAVVSTSQAAATGINTSIALDQRHRLGVRPPRYGRAAVFFHDTKGIPRPALDVKGTGVPADEIPELPHSNGLLTLDEAIHEILMEQLVLMVCRHAGATARPLPSYALIDLGFDALSPCGGEPDPAVQLLRRTATRPRCQWQRYPTPAKLAEAMLRFELLLRHYGLSASCCGAVQFSLQRTTDGLQVHRDGRQLNLQPRIYKRLARSIPLAVGQSTMIDGVNIQLASDPPDPNRLWVMDFGRYRFRTQFDTHLYAWLDADYESLNGLFVSPDDPDFVQPDPRMSLASLPETMEYQRLQCVVRQFRRHSDPRTLATALSAVLETAQNTLTKAAPATVPVGEPLRG